MRRPPRNIHELDNLILLRQALDILAADEKTQQALYPPSLDPVEEMRRLFADSWALVRPVFWPILTERVRDALEGIEQRLNENTPLWDEIREKAAIAVDEMPGKNEARRPRAWLDQIVAGKHYLQIRGQLD
jgi:hypothetical protein